MKAEFKNAGQQTYFELCRQIANKQGGQRLAINNIMEDHNGMKLNASYFKQYLTDQNSNNKLNEEEIHNLINETILNPSDYGFT